MNNLTAILERRQQEVDDRLDPSWQPMTDAPVVGAGNLKYELGDRVRATAAGGIGVIEQLVEAIGLRRSLDDRVHLLKVHLPYHESDHILAMSYNLLAGGQCIEDLERLRSDVSFLDAIGARRIPDPTTAGDFLRRFSDSDVHDLMEAQNDTRLRVWRQQPSRFRAQAVIDVDGTIDATTGKKKEGADFTYNGKFGYGPLVVSLANTNEVLYVTNSGANRPSHEASVPLLKKAVELVQVAGFRKVLLRGDTDFSLTKYFKDWDAEGVQFIFGLDANKSLVSRAQSLDDAAWSRLERPEKYDVKTEPREKRRDYKDTVVRMRGFKTLRLDLESWAEIEYKPSKGDGTTYRVIILRKNISVERGDEEMCDEIRYFFYVTNVPASEMSAIEVIYQSNARCNLENVIKQLKGGVGAMRMPAHDLVSNWAYIAIAMLAWNLKQWMGLMLPKRNGGATILKMQFRTFLNAMLLIPAQIKRGARQLTFRLLSYNKWVRVILDASQQLRNQRLAS